MATVPDVLVVGWAQANPMGTGVVDRELRGQLRQQGRLQIDELMLTTLRSPIEGAHRSPRWLVDRLAAVPSGARVVGSLMARKARLVHRLDPRLPPRFGREVVSGHDMAPMRFPDEGKLHPRFFELNRKVQGWICPSQFAASEINHFFPDAMTWVAPNGVSKSLATITPATDEQLLNLGITGPFVLHSGGANIRKNLPALAQAWMELDAQHQLVLVGPEHQTRSSLFSGLPRTRLLGRLPQQADVARLAARASVVVVPSLYEGFGLPALEAMALGAPVVAARTSALPEVCGDAAVLVDPTSVGIAEGLATVLGDADLQRALSAAGRVRASSYTWEACATAVMDAYEAALSGGAA